MLGLGMRLGMGNERMVVDGELRRAAHQGMATKWVRSDEVGDMAI